MKKVLFTGACTALVTPFIGGQVNYPMVERLLQRQIDAGISTIVLGGTTGESPTLSDKEKLELYCRGKAFVGDKAMIICGTGSMLLMLDGEGRQHAAGGWGYLLDQAGSAYDVGKDAIRCALAAEQPAQIGKFVNKMVFHDLSMWGLY